MICLYFISPTIAAPNYKFPPNSKIYCGTPKLYIPATLIRRSPLPLGPRPLISTQTPHSYSNSASNSNGEAVSGEEEGLVQEVRVPNDWLNNSKALEESEWLRVTLHKWLDDEYCPEETNVQISKVAAQSYYNSLIENQTDLGDILLKMAVDLGSISYQESFHGAFSSANAAVNLILQRIVEE